MMTILDFHWHLLLEPDKIKKIMEKNDIVKIIGMPLNFGHMSLDKVIELSSVKEKPKKYIQLFLEKIDDINGECYDIYSKYDWIEFVPILTVNPSYDVFHNILESDWFNDSQIIKFIPIFDNMTSDYYKKLEKMIDVYEKKVVMIHTGWGSEIHPLNHIIERFKDTKFVLSHMKEDDDKMNRDRIQALKTFDNVYVEMSYISSPKRLVQYVNMGYEDRILFGSDFRTESDEVSLNWFLNAVKLCGFDKKIETKILYQNARKLFSDLKFKHKILK